MTFLYHVKLSRKKIFLLKNSSFSSFQEKLRTKTHRGTKSHQKFKQSFRQVSPHCHFSHLPATCYAWSQTQPKVMNTPTSRRVNWLKHRQRSHKSISPIKCQLRNDDQATDDDVAGNEIQPHLQAGLKALTCFTHWRNSRRDMLSSVTTFTWQHRRADCVDYDWNSSRRTMHIDRQKVIVHWKFIYFDSFFVPRIFFKKFKENFLTNNKLTFVLR